MKKISGPVQIMGIISLFLVILMYINYLVHLSEGQGWRYWLNPLQDAGAMALAVPLFMMPILAFKLLFEGDESPIGRFLFHIGDKVYQWVYVMYEATIKGYLKRYRIAPPDFDQVGTVDLKENRKTVMKDDSIVSVKGLKNEDRNTEQKSSK